LYSFSRDEKEHEKFYELMKKAYLKVYERTGLGEKTFITYASGGSFSRYSHEFQTITDAGEDIINLCAKCNVAVNEEIIKEQPACPICGNKNLEKKKAVEVGNIFSLGTRFSDALGLKFVDENNQSKPVVMGSYGIGPARLMGTAVEVFADEKGIVWPEAIAPFAVHLVLLQSENKETKAAAEKIYESLTAKGAEVLFDDRDLRAGEKFADADLIGLPHRVTVSDKTVKAKKFELHNRRSGKDELVEEKELLKMLLKNP
jgi:prolyl-tRNA synthetase